MNGRQENDAFASRRLDELIARGEALIAARRDPPNAPRKFPDFGAAYRRWHNAGKELIADLSGPSDASDWNAGNCRAMYSLDQDAPYCLEEHERQQAMLLELRDQLASERAIRTGAALPQANFDRLLAIKPNPRGPAPEKLLEDLRRVAKAQGRKTVAHNDYLTRGRFSASAFQRQFGSWNNALEAAGLTVSRRQAISTEELLENLAQVWKKIGRQPVLSDLARPISKFSVAPYRLRFGGWARTLKAFAAWGRDGKLPEAAARSGPPPRLARGPGLRLRYTVFQRDHNKCVLCGRSPDTDPNVILHLDHIHPRSRGGESIPSNLRTLCSKCNLGKGDT